MGLIVNSYEIRILWYPEYHLTEHSYSLALLLENMQWARDLERNTS